MVAGSRAKYGPRPARDREAAVVPPGKRTAKTVGLFLELGDDDAPSLADARGKRPPANQAQVVAYLKAGKVLVMSPGLVKDAFDRGTLAGTRSMRTDGVYAWPDSLAFYVERYQVELPAEFEEHMAKREWKMPAEIDIVGLVPG